MSTILQMMRLLRSVRDSRAHPRLRRGVTLVELMIAMLVLAIVCVAWLEIIGIQSAKREARRREAVERLAGMMDAFMYFYRTGIDGKGTRSYYLNVNQDSENPISPLGQTPLTKSAFSLISDQEISKPFRDYLPDPLSTDSPKRNLLNLDPMGYRLVIVDNLTSLKSDDDQELFDGQAKTFSSSSSDGWGKKKWLIGLLYDKQGKKDEAGKPFFRLPVCLGL